MRCGMCDRFALLKGHFQPSATVPARVLRGYRDTSLRSLDPGLPHRLEQGCRTALLLAEVAQPHPDQPVELRRRQGNALAQGERRGGKLLRARRRHRRREAARQVSKPAFTNARSNDKFDRVAA